MSSTEDLIRLMEYNIQCLKELQEIHESSNCNNCGKECCNRPLFGMPVYNCPFWSGKPKEEQPD